ncbi:MAG: hypothetical protein IJC26_02830, partial [Clostridia bacterium]|nr:hypothetical protein [Clostridia bacterium]
FCQNQMIKIALAYTFFCSLSSFRLKKSILSLYFILKIKRKREKVEILMRFLRNRLGKTAENKEKSAFFKGM